jgi:hypothetical protein
MSPHVYHLIIHVSFHHLYLLSPVKVDGVVSIGKNSATPRPVPRVLGRLARPRGAIMKWQGMVPDDHGNRTSEPRIS